MRSMKEKKTPVDGKVEASTKVGEQDPQPMDEVTEGVVTETLETTEASAAKSVAEEEKSGPAKNGNEVKAAGDRENDTGEVDTTERPEESSFARLVKGWEALAEAGARNVQRARENESFQPLQMLQQLRLCGAGEGLARIKGAPPTDASGDPFEPIILRHTRSTPQQYQPMFPDDGGQVPPAPIRLDHMRRSSSTPSSSAFRQYSAGSAFGAHLRSMPHLGGHDDRSAFTLPSQRSSSFTSMSDSGVRYSAFDPVWFPQSATDAAENTAIEVTDGKPAASDSSDTNDEGKTSKSAASRAARFLRMSEGRYKRRRKRRDGRENPIRPTSISVSTQEPEDQNKSAVAVDDESKPADSTTPSATSLKSTIDINISSTRRTPTPTPQLPAVSESKEDVVTDAAKGESGGRYQQLDSDVDEEYEHFQRIETSLQQAESPTPIPSPAYQKFEDEQVAQPESNAGSGAATGGNRTPTVRIQVNTDAANHEGPSLTPNSQDSGNQSPGTIRSSMTGNTSGHTTIATSTSATVSSGHMSVLSSVSETDMEVMETNQAGKRRVKQQRKQRKLDSVVKSGRGGDIDGSMSVHSSSTGSTNTNGYVALVGSPASLRDGASMPVDRFFGQSGIPVGRSVSNISGSTGSSGSAGGRTSRTSKTSSNDSSPSKKTSTGQGSPASMTSEMATTNSSGSAGEEPPKFVSYLDQAKNKTLPPVGDDEERESPAEIVGYSAMVFEAATVPGPASERPAAIRPTKTGKDRSGRFGSRPPLSPIKGLRTPTTPPPSALGGPDSTSPAYQQLSPPRNIIDHRMGAGLSKPYVLRSSGQMFVSPESEPVDTSPKGWAYGVVNSMVGGSISPEGSQSGPVYTYAVDKNREVGPVDEADPSHGHICNERSIEVKNAPVNIVSPEKQE